MTNAPVSQGHRSNWDARFSRRKPGQFWANRPPSQWCQWARTPWHCCHLRRHCLLDHGLSPTSVGTFLGRSQPGLYPWAMPPTARFCTCFMSASLSCLLVLTFGLLIPSAVTSRAWAVRTEALCVGSKGSSPSPLQAVR